MYKKFELQNLSPSILSVPGVQWSNALFGHCLERGLFCLAVNLQFKEASLLSQVKGFPSVTNAEEEGAILFVCFGDVKDYRRANECGANLISRQPPHPTRKALAELRSAAMETSAYWSDVDKHCHSVADHLHPNAYEKEKEAKARLEEAKMIRFVRGGLEQNFSWRIF